MRKCEKRVTRRGVGGRCGKRRSGGEERCGREPFDLIEDEDAKDSSHDEGRLEDRVRDRVRKQVVRLRDDLAQIAEIPHGA